MKRKAVLLGVGMLGLVAVGAFAGLGNQGGDVAYRLGKVERGDIEKSVSASGELSAVVTVEVGSEISGLVSELFADFNSQVRAGQVIARIDPQRLEVKVAEAEAKLSVARASVAIKEAARIQARANLANARSVRAAKQADLERARVTAADLKRDFERKAPLRATGVIAVSTLDKARAAWRVAAAQVSAAKAELAAQLAGVAAKGASVKMAEAEVAHSRAQVAERQAALAAAKVDLSNTFIRSPVDGVVIGRNVDVGQTVAASLQAPTLFTIARDLRRMQVKTNIDEADIGQVRVGQTAVFTVDAYPGSKFRGRVTQVRKQPQTVQNVVTYTVVVGADNFDLRLLPGMTANVAVAVGSRAGVLKIPDAALRFRPPGAEPPAATGEGGFARRGPSARGPGGGGDRRARARARREKLVKELALDAEQQAKLGELAAGQRRRMRTLFQDGPGPGMREAIRGIRDEMNRKIMDFLTPAQRQKFARVLAGRRANPTRPGRVWVLALGKPEPVDLRIGIGDGSFTEMARGPLKEGADVIVSAKKAAGGKRRFFRFGF